jgi:hypothetical protein
MVDTAGAARHGLTAPREQPVDPGGTTPVAGSPGTGGDLRAHVVYADVVCPDVVYAGVTVPADVTGKSRGDRTGGTDER